MEKFILVDCQVQEGDPNEIFEFNDMGEIIDFLNDRWDSFDEEEKAMNAQTHYNVYLGKPDKDSYLLTITYNDTEFPNVILEIEY